MISFINVDGTDVEINVSMCPGGYQVTSSKSTAVGFGSTVSQARYHFYTQHRRLMVSQGRSHEAS